MDDTPDRSISLGDSGDEIASLHQELALLGFPVPADEAGAARYGAGTADAVARLLDADGGPAAAAGVTVDGRILEAALERSGRAAAFGTVTDPSGAPAAEIPLRLVARRLTGDESTLGDAVTDVAGRYAIHYSPGDGTGTAVELVVRAAGRGDDEAVLPCPAPRLARVDLRLSGWEPLRTIELAPLRAALEAALGGADPTQLSDARLETLAPLRTLRWSRSARTPPPASLARRKGSPRPGPGGVRVTDHSPGAPAHDDRSLPGPRVIRRHHAMPNDRVDPTSSA